MLIGVGKGQEHTVRVHLRLVEGSYGLFTGYVEAAGKAFATVECEADEAGHRLFLAKSYGTLGIKGCLYGSNTLHVLGPFF